ncbi:MAG: glycosyltransferase family A protein [Candidatus Paceibacterota bacterium]
MFKKQSHQPLISVVIPAFNEEKYLPACLKCLTEQSFDQPYEIIVADNNSTDETHAIAKKFGVKVILAKEKGYVFAAIAGIGATRGKIIAMTDADTRVPKNWLKRIHQAFTQYPQAVAIGGTFQYYDGSRIIRLIIKILNSIHPRLIIASLSGMNMSFKKEAYEAVGGFDRNINLQADSYIGNQLMKYGKIIILRDNQVLSSSRRMSTPLQTISEVLVRIVNAFSLKIFNMTVFKKQTDYR